MSEPYHFEALRVTARLRTGVICDEYLPLDGILQYQALRELLGPRDYSLPGGAIGPGPMPAFTLPLRVCYLGGTRREGAWRWYACSFAMPQPDPMTGQSGWWMTEGQDHWNKRFDQSYASLIDFAGKRGRVIIEQNRYRAYHMPVFYRVAEQIQWYCVGDLKEIERLLATVTHVGKKASQGWGRVIEWQVERWPEDWSCWRENKPMRALPASEAAERGAMVNLRYYGLRPSYYDHKNQMLVAVP